MTSSLSLTTLPNTLKRYYQGTFKDALKKPKMRATSAAVFSFLAVSLFAWYAVRPTAQTILYLRREITDKTDLNKQMENKITALIESQAVYEEIEDKLSLVDQALPHNPDGIILARQLKNLALISQSSISAIQIPTQPLLIKEATIEEKIAPTKPIEEFPVTMVITGQYENIKTFLTGLLSLRRVTAINSISIKNYINQEGNDGSLQLSIALKSFYSTQ
mgnify:FL=1